MTENWNLFWTFFPFQVCNQSSIVTLTIPFLLSLRSWPYMYLQPTLSFHFEQPTKKTCFCDLVSRHENGIWLFWLSRLGIWYQLNLFLLKCMFLLCSREKSSWQDEWYRFCSVLCFEINIPFKKPNQLRSMFCIC